MALENPSFLHVKTGLSLLAGHKHFWSADEHRRSIQELVGAIAILVRGDLLMDRYRLRKFSGIKKYFVAAAIAFRC